MRKIILVGYMGSGKSTIAGLLHKMTEIKTVDLDTQIEQYSQSTISNIFNEKGEIYFRKLEHTIFSELMNSTDDLILSLGGGTPCYANNHKLLNGENIVSFYLKASIETLSERLASNNVSRPLIAGKNLEEMKDFIAKNLFERSYYYHQATYTVKTDNKTPEIIASEIGMLLA